MPTPTKPILIAVKASTGTLTAGDIVKITNLTIGGTILGRGTADGECVINPADSGLDWSNGDTISIEINGRLRGSASATISKGGVTQTVVAAADTTSPAVSL